jgi:cellulose synthase operon protein C
MTPHGRAGDYLDDALDAEQEAAFLDHLARCEDCQRELEAEVQLRDREDALRGGPSLDQHAEHGRAGEYLDGALSPDREAAFLDHLAVCALCQHDLHDEVQLRDREDALRARTRAPGGRGEPDPRPPDSEASRVPFWRRSSGWVAAAVATGAAAVLAVKVIAPPPPPPQPAPASQIVLLPPGADSPVEIRLSAAVAAGVHLYNPNRGSTASRASISPADIAELDRRGDCLGVAAAYVLDDQLPKAEAQYHQCKPVDAKADADLKADRAGLAVLRKDFEAALDLTQQVIDERRDHAVAWWNRALALRGLGLERAAVAAFKTAAAIDRTKQPRWADDASERARAMNAEVERVRSDYKDVLDIGAKMADGGPLISALQARQVPGLARLRLHDAIRTATTPERLDEIERLVAELDATFGDLRGHIADVRKQLSPERTAAAQGYAAMLHDVRAVDDGAWQRWLALATRAHADDLILGARIATRRLDGKPSAEQLAKATRDPWFVRSVEITRVLAARDAGRIDDAAARLHAIEEPCSPTTPVYRCMQLELARAKVAIDLNQPPAAKRHALAALALANQQGDVGYRDLALTLAADAERYNDEVSVARAYYEEAGLSKGDPCDVHNQAFAVAEMLFRHHQIAAAHEQVAAAPACTSRISTVELALRARLLRVGRPVEERAALAADITAARSKPELVRDAPYLDYLAAWIDLDSDPTARERLAAAAESSRRIEGSMREKTLAAIDNALFADAGRQAAWSEALAVVSRAHGVAPPSRCALAFGADDTRFVAIAVAADGAMTGEYQPDVAHGNEWLAPRRLQDTLAGCDEVAVLSLSPWLGIGPVLDAATPWHYVLGRAASAGSGHGRVIVVDPAIPRDVGLPPLAPRALPELGPLDEVITGAAATPERVLASIGGATLIEIHSHGTLERLGSPAIALAPGAGGWKLGVEQIRSARLTGAPLVVLADCAGGVAAKFEHEAEGLPLAFRAAGARAVIASLADIPDREAGPFFDAVISQISTGASPAKAVARVRAEKVQRDPASWMRHVVVFQ